MKPGNLYSGVADFVELADVNSGTSSAIVKPVAADSAAEVNDSIFFVVKT